MSVCECVVVLLVPVVLSRHPILDRIPKSIFSLSVFTCILYENFTTYKFAYIEVPSSLCVYVCLCVSLRLCLYERGKCMQISSVSSSL